MNMYYPKAAAGQKIIPGERQLPDVVGKLLYLKEPLTRKLKKLHQE